MIEWVLRFVHDNRSNVGYYRTLSPWFAPKKIKSENYQIIKFINKLTQTHLGWCIKMQIKQTFTSFSCLNKI